MVRFIDTLRFAIGTASDIEQTMNKRDVLLSGEVLHARGSGALFWPNQKLLLVSDLHLGKSERIARSGGTMLPPYETQDTLARLDAEIAATDPATVLCLGDSFDDLAASQALEESVLDWISRLMAGRRWIWLEGNHDPGPVNLGGSHLAEYQTETLVFRHIAQPGATAEISGHYHPKASIHARGRSVSRPCFLCDQNRIIMPAFGTYTGGLRSTARELQSLMRPDAVAILTGKTPQIIPMPRRTG